MAILRACIRCGRLSDRSRCPEHRPKDRRPGSAKRGYGPEWKRVRDRYLATHSRCECGPDCCPRGCDRPAAHVDHIDGLGPRGPRGYDQGNLQALAVSCHSRKTVRENGGFGRLPVRGAADA